MYSYGFARLPAYYTPDLLTQTKVMEVDRVPVPPLSTFGLSQFRDFEEMDADGITYLDTYFVRREAARRESLHFHELVHAAQWRILGPERFLALYAEGLEKSGYRDSPLELMAYDLHARFDLHTQPFDVENRGEAPADLQRRHFMFSPDSARQVILCVWVRE